MCGKKMLDAMSFQELRDLSASQVERIQNAKFHASAKNLLPHTSFYSGLFRDFNVDPADLRTVEDWQKLGLPLIKKQHYKNQVQDFIVKPGNPFKVHLSYMRSLGSGAAINFLIGSLDRQALAGMLKDFYHPKMPFFSGGTQSGKPTPVLATGSQLRNLKNVMGIAFNALGRDFLQDTVGMNLFPYGPHLAWHAVHTAFDIGADLNLATAAGGAMRTKDLVVLADKFRANVFAGMGYYIAGRFLPLAVKSKIRLRENAVFINGSEAMLPKDKEKILQLSRKLGVKNPLVLDFYGASELKEDIFIECLPGSGFHHIAPLSSIIRTVRINKMPKGDGYITDWEFTKPEEGGAAVIWNINGAGTVLNGYLLGDKYEKIIKGRCPNCMLNTERVYGISRLEMKK